MTELLCGEVHSVPTGIAGRHIKEGWQQLGVNTTMCCKNSRLNKC